MLDRRLLIVTGKGGTGRSAVTAALALRAAREGQRVLAMSMAEAGGLAIHFGVSDLSYEPAEVHPGVWALGMDRAKALDEYIHIQGRLPRLTPVGPIARSLNVVAEAVPGIRDAITVGKATYEVGQEEWDLVVADGPPLGQIMSYLRSPTVIAELVPAGPVQDQATRMAELLVDPSQAGLVITTVAEELPVVETNQALDELEDEPVIQVACVAVNGVLEELPGTEAPEGPIGEAARLQRRLWAWQEQWRAEIPEGPALPFLFGIHTPGEVAARLADEWPS